MSKKKSYQTLSETFNSRIMCMNHEVEIIIWLSAEAKFKSMMTVIFHISHPTLSGCEGNSLQSEFVQQAIKARMIKRKATNKFGRW